jgi:hypothetical protein
LICAAATLPSNGKTANSETRRVSSLLFLKDMTILTRFLLQCFDEKEAQDCTPR